MGDRQQVFKGDDNEQRNSKTNRSWRLRLSRVPHRPRVLRLGTVFADGVPVEFVGWAGPDTTGREDDAYHVADFFGNDGKYRGPDQHGTYPVFAIA